MLILIVASGPDKGRVHQLADDRPHIIGRRSKSVAQTLPTDDRKMSRQHAQLECVDGRWFVTDLGSRNGTYVNGTPIAGRTLIANGDRLQLGASLMVAAHQPDAQAPPTPVIDLHYDPRPDMVRHHPDDDAPAEDLSSAIARSVEADDDPTDASATGTTPGAGDRIVATRHGLARIPAASSGALVLRPSGTDQLPAVRQAPTPTGGVRVPRPWLALAALVMLALIASNVVLLMRGGPTDRHPRSSDIQPGPSDPDITAAIKPGPPGPGSSSDNPAAPDPAAPDSPGIPAASSIDPAVAQQLSDARSALEQQRRIAEENQRLAEQARLRADELAAQLVSQKQNIEQLRSDSAVQIAKARQLAEGQALAAAAAQRQTEARYQQLLAEYERLRIAAIPPGTPPAAVPPATSPATIASPEAADPTHPDPGNPPSGPSPADGTSAPSAAAVPEPAPAPEPIPGTIWDHLGPDDSIVFVVDASGSLIDAQTIVARRLGELIDRLRETQRFAVIFFQGGKAVELPPTGLRSASPERKAEVRRWIDPGQGNVRPLGRANPLPALDIALVLRPDHLCLLADRVTPPPGSETVPEGQVSAEDLLDHLARTFQGRSTRLHVMQLFESDARGVLRTLAGRFRGTYQNIRPAPDKAPTRDPLLDSLIP